MNIQTQTEQLSPYVWIPRALALIAIITCFPSTARAQENEKADAAKVTYDDQVQAIFRQRCSSCHSPNKRSGDLDVTSYLNLMQGGASGAVIEAGDLEFSYLYSLVTHSEEPHMPPGNQKIPDAELKLIADWINGGALENKGSKALIKKKVDMSIVANPTAKPEVIPIPARTVLEPVIQPETPPNADAIATSPWAPIVALGGQKQVLLYNTQTTNLAGVIPFEDGQVNSLRFSRNGQLLAIGGGKAGLSGKVLIWNLAEGEPLTTIGEELDAVLACDVSPDQSMVALGGPGKVVKVFSTESGELLFEMTKHTDWVTAIEFSPDGALLASGDRNGGLQTWEAMTGREYMTLKGHTAAITSVSWRSDSNLVASASEDMTIRLWELNGGSQIKSWNGHGEGTLSIEFTRDGRIVSSGRDKLAKLWDQQGAQVLAFPAMNDVASDVSFCDETNCVLASAFGGQVAMWKVEGAALVKELSMNPPPLTMQLETAQQKVSQTAITLEQTTIGFAAAKASHDDMLVKLNTAVADRQATETKINELVALVATSSGEVSAAEAAQTAANELLVQSNAALPLVEESLAKLNDAAAKSPNDDGLKQSVAAISTQLESMKSQNAQFQQQVESSTQTIAAVTQVVSENNSQIEANKAAMATLDQLITEMQTAIEPLKTTMDSIAAELNAAQVSHQVTAAEVEYWTNEIAFKQQLETLSSQLVTADQAAAAKQELFDAAQQQLAAAQAAVDAAKKELAETEAAVQVVKDQVRSAKQPVSVPATSSPEVPEPANQ